MAVARLSAARQCRWLWRSESSFSHNHHFHSGISSILPPSPPLHSFMGLKEEQEEGNRIPNFSSFQALPSSGSMQLMAVPKKKVSRSKRGIRNGPKALKPVPVIVRCKCCGRVKLPHFYCCSGDRGTGQQTEDAK